MSIANVLSASPPSASYSFVSDDDSKLLSLWESKSFEIQVGLHELLGHGSGKIFTSPQSFVSPIDGKPCGYYKPGQTYTAVFQSLANQMEECRAESCALYLSVQPEILDIFGYHGCTLETVSDVTYTAWLVR